MASWKRIASDSGNKSNAIGREEIRECLHGWMESMDPCWEIGAPNRCYHGSY